MKAANLIEEEISSFYTRVPDENRYKSGLGPLELTRNKNLIQRYIAARRQVILDIGGGTGVYSEWLAGLGHEVYLVDPVFRNVQLAKKKAAGGTATFKCLLGEARSLDFEDKYADLVLLHGPLYHLQHRAGRLKVIREARRVCRTGGRVMGVAINYCAYVIAGLFNGMIHDFNFFQMCRRHLETGIHHAAGFKPHTFLPAAYFHRPDDLENEFKEAGLFEVEVLAVEGISWLDQYFFQHWEDPVKRKTLLSLLEMTEKDPAFLGISPHLMVVGKR